MIVDVVQYGAIPGVNVAWLHVDRTKTSLAFSLQLADIPQSIETSYYTVVL